MDQTRGLGVTVFNVEVSPHLARGGTVDHEAETIVEGRPVAPGSLASAG
ncbi:MAG: hypothetical protein ABR532_01770 [Candidatus Dormibacteria bacterium]